MTWFFLIHGCSNTWLSRTVRGQYHEPDFFITFTLTWVHKPSSIPKVWAVWGPLSMDSATMNQKCSGLEWISRPAIHGTVDAMRTVDICPDSLTEPLHSILAWWVGAKKMVSFVHLASSLAEYQKQTIEHFKVPLHNTYNEQEWGGWLFRQLCFLFSLIRSSSVTLYTTNCKHAPQIASPWQGLVILKRSRQIASLS